VGKEEEEKKKRKNTLPSPGFEPTYSKT